MTVCSKIVQSVLAAALVATFPAAAQAAELQFRQTVAYGDLDLTTVEGTAELDRRIKRAANRVCRQTALFYHMPPSVRPTCWRLTYAETKSSIELAIAEARGGSQQASDTRGVMVVSR